jgi:hypothetical protein
MGGAAMPRDGFPPHDSIIDAVDAASILEDMPNNLPDLMVKFNAQYAIVNEEGICVVYERVTDPVLHRKKLIRIKFEDFKKFYQNRLITVTTQNGGSTTKSAANWWLDSPFRRQYLGGVTFDPTGKAPANCWNLYSGFAVDPAPGNWSLMRNHICEVICSRNDEHTEYLLNWIARMFQEPNQPGEVAVVVRGLKGVGKGILFVNLVRAWGQHGLHIANAKHLIGNFNAHLRDCIALLADEAFYAGDRQHESVLKALVTEPTLPIEGKYRNVVTAPNMLHVMMASNLEWVVPASKDERRYFALNASDHRVGQRQYFADIADQMKCGGLAAMLWDILRRDLSRFDVRDIPDTEALQDQKLLSLDTLDRWWKAVLDRGFVWRSRYGAVAFDEWNRSVTTELLHESYLQWCRDNRVNYPMSREQLGKRMATMYQWQRLAVRQITGEVEALAAHADPVIKKPNQPGYLVDTIDQAMCKFMEVRGVPMSAQGSSG